MAQAIIVGAGLAGLSAALTLARQQIRCVLISVQPSERAQSVLAEGGINGALDTMGEQDTPQAHFDDTMRGGAQLADPDAVAGLTAAAPEILRELAKLGVPFYRLGGVIQQRNFGGQRKKRTAYAQSSTGRVIMTALTDAVRQHEAAGTVTRLAHHEMLRLLLHDGRCTGVRIRDLHSGALCDLTGKVILCTGGMNGMFPSLTTGTVQNTGDAAAAAFMQGALLANPEMLQFHPTTVGIPGKRMLVSEAARGEGGRLYVLRNGTPWYFMRELHPALGDLSPRDVIAREMFRVRQMPECDPQIFLDLTALDADIWKNRLADLRAELIHWLEIDPQRTPVPVHEGIHYFMGGLDVDMHHRTAIPGLWAAGECACQYHGANRLGGNSMLGAIYGGKTAAQSLAGEALPEGEMTPFDGTEPYSAAADPRLIAEISGILTGALGIVRHAGTLRTALDALSALRETREYNARERARFAAAEAMLRGALERRESRGAHFRSDFPAPDEAFRKTTVAAVQSGAVTVTFRDIAERRAADANIPSDSAPGVSTGTGGHADDPV